MNRDLEIVHRLDDIGRDWPADASVGSAVLARLDEGGWTMVSAQPPGFRRIFSGRRLVAAALLAVVGIVTVMWGGGSSQTVYAQVQRTLARAKSVHVIWQVIINGEPKHAGDMWYLRDVGFRSQLGPQVRIDDGQHAWLHVEGEPSAYRSGATGENAELWNNLFDLRTQLDRDFVRAPERDRTIGDVHTKCFIPSEEFEKRVAPVTNGSKMRPVVYIAPGFELRRVELEMFKGGEWKVTSVQDWQYDVEVDRALFRPEFGADVKIVDADKAFEDFFSLDKAVYQETRNGLIYAVHWVERFEGGGLALLTSVRGAEETLSKYPLEWRRLGPGRMVAEPPATNYTASPQGDKYFRIRMASASSDGIDAQWWVLVPRDEPPTVFDVGPGRVWVPAAMIPRGNYAKVFADSKGVTPILSWTIELEVPTQTPRWELSAITDRTYRDLKMLTDVSTSYLDLGIENDRFVARLSAPDQVTAEAFAIAVAQHIRWWQQRDLEFDRKRNNNGGSVGESSPDEPE